MGHCGNWFVLRQNIDDEGVAEEGHRISFIPSIVHYLKTFEWVVLALRRLGRGSSEKQTDTINNEAPALGHEVRQDG